MTMELAETAFGWAAIGFAIAAVVVVIGFGIRMMRHKQ
jgi:hypothetical protein